MADAQALERQERSLEGAQRCDGAVKLWGLLSEISQESSNDSNGFGKRIGDLQILHISWFSLNQTICHRFPRYMRRGTWSMFPIEASSEVFVSAASVPMLPSGVYVRSKQVMEMCIFWGNNPISYNYHIIIIIIIIDPTFKNDI